jgi:protein-disulfide isomerase
MIPMSESAPSEPTSTMNQAQDGDFVVLRRSQLVLMLVPLACVAGLAAGYLLWGRQAPSAVVPTGVAQPLPTVQRHPVEVDDDPAIGPEDAPIEIVEFSDFNCPYCRRFHTETFTPLMAAYPDQIRFVYRDYPITSQESFAAAQAANCAGRQGSYWEFHDALFSGELGLGRAAYEGYAERLGLDVPTLAACIDGGLEQDEIEADARAAAALGVTGTPTFFINGIALVGAQPLSQFRSVIDGELNP